MRLQHRHQQNGSPLYIKSNVQNITVLHFVVLSFNGELAGLFALELRPQSHKVVVLDNLGSDEATLQIAVDDARSLRCQHTLGDGPRPVLLATDREERYEVQ